MIEKICTKEVWRAKYEFGEILGGAYLEIYNVGRALCKKIGV
jgi:hypothetical protein